MPFVKFTVLPHTVGRPDGLPALLLRNLWRGATLMGGWVCGKGSPNWSRVSTKLDSASGREIAEKGCGREEVSYVYAVKVQSKNCPFPGPWI